jgi:hypothetical protein
MKKPCCCLCLFGLVLFFAPLLPAQSSSDGKPQPDPCKAAPPSNVQDAAKLALACEWLDRDLAGNVLYALDDLTKGSEIPFATNVLVLCRLRDPIEDEGHILCDHEANPKYQGVYRGAMGDPNKYGEPTVQGQTDFVELLATANTLGDVSESQLFTDTKNLVSGIFVTGGGKLALVQINAEFDKHNNYRALYLLLAACVNSPTCHEPHLLTNLEKFRAALAADADKDKKKLAKQVAATIAPPAKK